MTFIWTKNCRVDYRFSLPALSHRREADLELLWLLSKEGWLRSHLDDYAAQQEALSRFTIGALLLTPGVLGILRRELRRVSPDAKIGQDQIEAVLASDVIKRDVLEGERAIMAKRLITRAAKRALREKAAPTPHATSHGEHGVG